MARRSKRQQEIVATMIDDALTSAKQYEADCEEFAESQKLKNMADVIADLGAWLEERDGDRLEACGISMDGSANGQLLFRMEGKARPFVVRRRADISVPTDCSFVAGGRIVHLNRDLPVLDIEVYELVLERIFNWAGLGTSRPGRRYN